MPVVSDMLTPTSRRVAMLSIAATFAVTLGAAILVAWLATPGRAASGHFANADDVTMTVQGKRLYARHCASCHGRALQGQPLWQLLDEDAARRAPAHDETGHTWQHSDEDLFHMTKYGRFAATAPDSVSYMPAYADVLSDDEILAIIAFIKARWPLSLRVSQALLNPGYAGMPPDADKVEWKFPLTCNVTLQRSRASARKSD
jgi:mono/diheme cytochrome c family protein